MCFDEGTLQAYIDNELDDDTHREVRSHIMQCPRCRSKLKELKEIDSFVSKAMYVPPINTDTAWLMWSKKMMKRRGVFNMVKRYKKYIATAAAIAFIASSIIFQPVRNVEAHLLSLFRLNKFQAVTITPDDIQKMQMQFQQNGINNIDLKEFGDIKITGDQVFQTFQPDEVDKFKASLEYNISIPQADNFKIQYLNIEKSRKIEFKLNVDKVNSLIKTFGGNKLFPESLKGKTFTVNLGDIAYVNMKDAKGQDKNGSFLTMGTVKVPEITVPEGVDLNEVRDAVINLPFLPDNIKKQIAAINDWKNTIPVPLANDNNSSSEAQNVTINGNPGILVVHRLKNQNYQYSTLAWVKGDVIYTLQSSNLQPDQLIQIAQSMR